MQQTESMMPVNVTETRADQFGGAFSAPGWISFFSPPTAWPGGQAVLSRPVNPDIHWTLTVTGLDWTRRNGGEKAVCILDQC